MAFDQWNREKSWGNNEKCCNCHKKISKGEEFIDHCWRDEDGNKGIGYREGEKYCLNCYEEKEQGREQRRQENQRREQERLEEELNNLNSESLSITFRMMASLGNPSVEDVKEINKYKKKVKKFLKKVENKELDGKENLQEELVKLDKFFEEHVSPQLSDKASNNKARQRKGNKKCFHDNVEKYEDESRYYCSYCWDESSPEFLKVLERKGLKQGENSNSPNPPNTHTERERESKFNWTPYILGGIGLFTVLSFVYLILTQRRKYKKVT